MKHIKHTFTLLLAVIMITGIMPLHMFAEAEDSAPVSGVSEEISFDPGQADYLSYDPLYIAEYADPEYVNTDEIEMDRYTCVAAAAKGVATYNLKKQSDFEVTEENFLAAANYQMPVYDIDDDSAYYLAIPDVNKFNGSFRAYDLTVAYNNDNGEVISGWKYKKGILYIPKSALDDPDNTKDVPEGAEIAVQINYAIGSDMDFSKDIPVQILTVEGPENRCVTVPNIFDADCLTVETGVKGRHAEDVSVFLNGQMMPVNDEAWEYDRSDGSLHIKAMPAIVSNINIVFGERSVADRAKDLGEAALGLFSGEAYAASKSLSEMTPLRNSSGQEVKLSFDVSSMFVGWRGHYSTKVLHKSSRSSFDGCSEWENSVYYLYGGYTTMSGADMSTASDREKDAGLAPLWAIMSYTYGGDTGLATNTDNIQYGTLVKHYVSKDSTETHTMYEWLLKYRNSLEKSKEVWADRQGNGLAGANNFAAHWPVNITVKGSETGLVPDGTGGAENNPDFVFATEQLSNSDWYAASCSELDDAAASESDSDVYVTCLDLTDDYIVLAFARASGANSQTMTAIYKFGIDAGYVRIKKQPSQTANDFLTEAPNNYGLEGAVYELYTDPSCSAESRACDLSGNYVTLTTGSDGYTDAVPVRTGTYYAREVTASRGYELDTACPGTTVCAYNTAEDPALIISTEKPSYGIPGLIVYKIDPTGKYAWKKLCGAEYKISYYDAVSKDRIDLAAPKRSWIFKTRKMEGSDVKGAVYAGFNWSSDDALPGSSDFYMEDGQRIIPCGWITIQEISAPSGLALNTEVCYGRVCQPQNGAAAVTDIDGADKSGILRMELTENDEPQAVKLIIDKKNAYTGKSEAQESEKSHSSTRLARFSSLAGAQYEVYYDDDDLGAPELVGVITTDEKGHGELSERELGDKRMLGDKLAVGEYIIREVKSPPGFVTDGYVLSGNTQKERGSGSIEVICSYDADGKAVKKTINGKYSEGNHIFRTRAESEDTELFTYTVSSADEPVRVHISKKDITTGDELPGAKLQIISLDPADKGTVVEEWTSTSEEHTVWELPSGRYKLREISAPYGYDVAEDAEFEVKEGVIEYRVEMQNRPLHIATSATDRDSGTHHGMQSGSEVICDRVNISGLYGDREYELEGCLADRASGEVLKDAEGNEIRASKKFTAAGSTVEIKLEFTVDTSAFDADKSIVAFEKLYRTSPVDGEEQPASSGDDGFRIELAQHEDLSNESQTVRYGGIVSTMALDRKARSKNIAAGKNAVMKDYVEYKNLSPEETYTLEAAIYDRTDGVMTDAAAVTDFTPAAADGTFIMEIKADLRETEGHELVVFEKLYLNGRLISAHEDPGGSDQTVYIQERSGPVTADTGRIALYVIPAVTALAALLIMCVKRIKELA